VSVYHEALTEVIDPTNADEIVHAVCSCQWEATPRLALCGWDCTDMTEGEPITRCVVCADLNQRPCALCGGLA
jgi:hypothetical protein